RHVSARPRRGHRHQRGQECRVRLREGRRAPRGGRGQLSIRDGAAAARDGGAAPRDEGRRFAAQVPEGPRPRAAPAMSRHMRPADLTPLARDVMKLPASVGLIFSSFVAAYLLMVLPWSGAWLAARPDFLLLVLLFWTLQQPNSIGQGMAFFLGLLMDVSDSMLLGQHALAYVIAVYGAQVFRVRILAFPIPEQTLHVLAVTILATSVMMMLNLLLGADFPGFSFFASPVITAILWGPVNWILYLPAVRRRRGDARS